MKRCPRDHFTIATKFPTFSITVADRYKAAPIFEMQFRSVYKELHADHETGAADNK